MFKKLLPILLIIAGCSNSPTVRTGPPINLNEYSVNEMPQIIEWSSLGPMRMGTFFWLLEAKKRFNNPIVFSCHGGTEYVLHGDHREPEWWCYPDAPRQKMPMQVLADTLANLYPDRDIILATCNPGGFDIHTKRVWYARRQLWTIPDDFAADLALREKQRDFDSVGSVWELVSFDGLNTQPPIPTTKPTTRPNVLTDSPWLIKVLSAFR